MKLWLLCEPAPSWQGLGLTPNIAEFSILMGAAAYWLALSSSSSHQCLDFSALLSLGCWASGRSSWLLTAQTRNWPPRTCSLWCLCNQALVLEPCSRLSVSLCTQRCQNSSLSCRQEMRKPCFRSFRKSSRVIMAHYLMARVYLGFLLFHWDLGTPPISTPPPTSRHCPCVYGNHYYTTTTTTTTTAAANNNNNP